MQMISVIPDKLRSIIPTKFFLYGMIININDQQN